MKKLCLISSALAMPAIAACADASPSSDPNGFGYEGTGIQFTVAPLTLESLTDACYSFAVVNGSSELVVGRGPAVTSTGLPGVTNTIPTPTAAVCATQFGNSGGGDISYVAPCDADDGQQNHTVHLWIDALCASGTGAGCTEIQSYVDPCPDVNGCTLNVTCVENADTPVTFNFTIMGQADQGFFDIAVNFDDIFCSAKVDCEYSDGSPLTLLHNPNKPGTPRDQTVVLGRACTAGPGEATQVHSSATFIACGYTQQFGSFGYFVPFHILALLPHSDAEGNLGVSASVASQLSLNTGTDNWDSVATPDYLFQTAVYHGEEALESGGTNLGKVYWNHAVGIDWDLFQAWIANIAAPYVGADGDFATLGLNECRIVSRFTATDDGGLPPNPPPAGTYSSYPIIASDVVLWRDGPDPTPSTLQCTAHPLNGTPGGVRTMHPVYVEGSGWIEVFTNGSFTYSGLFPFFLDPYNMMTSANLGQCRTGDGVGQDLLTVCP